MERTIVTAYGRIINVSDVSEFFTEVFIREEFDPPYMVGATLKNGDIVCIARLWNSDLKAMFYSALYGIFRNSSYTETVFNTNVELERLKKILEAIEYVTDKNYGYEDVLRSVLYQLMYGVGEDEITSEDLEDC